MKRIITHQSIQISFKAKFVHHSATRESTETIVVEIKNQEGLTGYGESCPRYYVTGETIKSAHFFIKQTIPLIENLHTLAELKSLQEKINLDIDKNPSAWCALEMAMLDLLAQEKQQSVEVLLGVKSTPIAIPYTAVIGINSYFSVLIKLLIYKLLGFSDYKIKLSGNSTDDLKTLKLISLCSKAIRVDANNPFKTSKEAIDYLQPLLPYIWAIEEPVSSNAFTEMKDIAEALKIKIILDESFLNESSLEKIKDRPDIFIPNLRISKLGGVLRTQKLVAALEEKKFQWILGSHVGEMSLLTRASFLISGSAPKNLKALEGGFSTHLLRYDPFFPNLKLGRGATIKTESFLTKYGWGMRKQ